MRGELLIKKIELRRYMPRTIGDDPILKKKELMRLIHAKIDDYPDARNRCRGKLLSLEVVFYLDRQTDEGSHKDLDNMLKILCDTFPDYLDKNRTENGLGLIEGDSDHSIYEIHSVKRLVDSKDKEGIDVEVYEWSGEDKVARAAVFAKQRHKNQLRKDNSTEYWHHLQDVVNNARHLGIEDKDVLCAAWLHDTIEDTNTDFDDIKEHFGLHVAQVVAAVTKDKRMEEETREQYYLTQLQAASWKAQVVKFCDILANLADLPSGYEEFGKRVEQAEKKLRYFEVIRKGLHENRAMIPNLDKGLDELKAIMSIYGKAISP